jgi:hypothetical protein
MARWINRRKYSDLVLRECPQNSTAIHVDMSEAKIGSNFLLGWITNYMIDKYGFAQFEEKMSDLINKNINIVIDNIMGADDDSLLNPGILIMFGNEISDLPENWGVIITHAIEY